MHTSHLLDKRTFNYILQMKTAVSAACAWGVHWEREEQSQASDSAQTKTVLESLLSMPAPEKALSNQAVSLPEVLIKLFLGNTPGQSAVCA